MLEGLKVFQGRTDGDSFAFDPKTTITRGEVATIIYRLVTGDTTTDGPVKYASYAIDKWPNDPTVTYLYDNYKHMAGAIGYCANHGIIKGDEFGFRANDTVTGYEALAMVLRAIGYDQNREFSGGEEWRFKVATTAQKRGVLDNLKTVSLGMPATREEVAEMLFQAATIAQVNYSALIQDYITSEEGLGIIPNPSLAWQVFKLKKDAKVTEWDSWGRPGYRWYRDSTGDNSYEAYRTSSYNSGETTVAIIKIEPVITWTDQQHECDIAAACKFDGEKSFELFVNSKTAITKDYKVVATDTVTPVGGQGRLTEVYYGSDVKRVVMIDTFLAEVTSVSKIIRDAADHVITPSILNVKVWDKGNDKDGKNYSEYAMTDSKADWEFAVGDYLLVSGWTNQDGLTTQQQKEAYAYTVRPLSLESTPSKIKATNQGAYWDTPVKAESFTGTQTVVHSFTSSRTVDGTEYPDAMTFYKGQPIENAVVKYTWFKDRYGNLTGVQAPGTSQYGIITGMYWSIGVGSNSGTDGAGHAVANVTLSDGTKTTMNIANFVLPADSGSTTNYAHAVPAKADVKTYGYGVITPYYDYANNNPMAIDGTAPAASSGKEVGSGSLMVAPYVSANKNPATNSANIITEAKVQGQLFKFSTDSLGQITAAEVAGNGAATVVKAENGTLGNAPFERFYNDVVAIADGSVLSVTKSAAYVGTYYMNYDTTANEYIIVNDKTQFMIQSWLGDGSTSTVANSLGTYTAGARHADSAEIGGGVSVFAGLSSMPGTALQIPNGAEIDWIDENKDGIADVVFTVGRVAGNTRFGLFYPTRVQSSWNYSTNQGTIVGHLDGAGEAEYVIRNATVYNNLVASIPATGNGDPYTYRGRLFALRLDNGEITGGALIENNVKTGSDPYTGATYAMNFLTSGEVGLNQAVQLKSDGTEHVNLSNGQGTGFYVGIDDGGNGYTDLTRAICLDGATLGYSNGTLTMKDGSAITISKTTDTTTNNDADNTANVRFTNVNASSIVTGGGQIYNLDNCYVTVVYNDVANNFDADYTLVALQVYLTQKTITPSTQTYTYSVNDLRTVKVSQADGLYLDSVTYTAADGSSKTSTPTLTALDKTAFYQGNNVEVSITIRALNDTGITTYSAYLGNNKTNGELSIGNANPVTWKTIAPSFTTGETFYITMDIVDKNINNGTALNVWSGVVTVA